MFAALSSRTGMRTGGSRRGRLIARVILLLAGHTVAAPVHAQTGSDATDHLAQALVLQQEFAAAEQQWSLYLQAAQSAFRLERVRVYAGNTRLIEHLISPAENAALADGAALWILDPAPGAGTLSVEVLAAGADDSLGERPKRWLWELQKARTPKTGEALTLSLERAFWRPWRWHLKSRTHQDRLPLIQADAALLCQSGRPLRAAARLLQAEARQPLPEEAALLLAMALAELGINQQRINRIARGSGSTADQARIFLAEQALANKQIGQSREHFSRVSNALAPPLRERADSLAIALGYQADLAGWSAAELARGRVALAAYNVLTQASTPASRHGLDRLGQLKMRDELGWAVRDRANLVLGYWHLRAQDPKAAEAALSRIRQNGPAANAGRLALGWAQISPGQQRPQTAPRMPEELGTLLRPRSDDELARLRRSTPFRTAQGVAQGVLADGLKRALQPWAEMIGADPLDPAVQESMLAIPYALSHLGAHEDAQRHLLASSERLQRLSEVLHQVVADKDRLHRAFFSSAQAWDAWVPGIAHTGGSRWWRQDKIPAYFFVETLLRNGRLQPLLKRCRQIQDALALTRPTAAQMPRTAPIADLPMQLANQRSVCETQIVAAAQDEMRRWIDTVTRYAAESHMALARLHDRQALAARALP